MVYAVIFGRSRASTFEQALALAKQSPSFREQKTESGRGTEYVVTFQSTREDVLALSRLWSLVEPWQSARLLVDGLPYALSRGAFEMSQILGCMTRALSFEPPQRYCRSSDSDSWRWPKRPPFSCRMLTKLRPRDLDAIDWADAERRADSVTAVSIDRGLTRCPFFDLAPFLSDLAQWRSTAPVETPPPWLSDEHVSRIEVDLFPSRPSQ